MNFLDIIQQDIFDMLYTRTGLNQITVNSNFKHDLYLDSLDIIFIISECEQRYDIFVPYKKCNNVKELCLHIEQQILKRYRIPRTIF